MAIETTITKALRELKEKLGPLSSSDNLPEVDPITNQTFSQLEEALSQLLNPANEIPESILSPDAIKEAYIIRKKLEKFSDDDNWYRKIKNTFSERRDSDLKMIQGYASDTKQLLPTFFTILLNNRAHAIDVKPVPPTDNPSADIVQSHLEIIRSCMDTAKNWYAPDIVIELASLESVFCLYLNSQKKREENQQKIREDVFQYQKDIKEPASGNKQKKKHLARFLVLPAALLAIVGSDHQFNTSLYPEQQAVYENNYLTAQASEQGGIKEYRVWPKTLSNHDLSTFIREEGMYDLSRNSQGDFPNSYISRPDGVVIDKATILMWSSLPHSNFLDLQEARKQVKQLNRSFYKGYNNWKIPTMEQLLTIHERDRCLVPFEGIKLHIDSVFPQDIPWAIWSSDPYSGDLQWNLDLRVGKADTAYPYDAHAGVLLVRRAQ